jgi:cbb3-type cytochrome oxidase subunit 3
MTGQALYAFAAGTLFMSLLLAIGCFIAFRPSAQHVPREAMLIFRAVLALAGGAFAAVISGFLNVGVRSHGWAIKAGGGLAVLVLIYLTNPPDLIERRSSRPRRAVPFSVPRERISNKASQDNQ